MALPYVEGKVHQGGDARVNRHVVADLKCMEELFHSVISLPVDIDQLKLPKMGTLVKSVP